MNVIECGGSRFGENNACNRCDTSGPAGICVRQWNEDRAPLAVLNAYQERQRAAVAAKNKSEYHDAGISFEIEGWVKFDSEYFGTARIKANSVTSVAPYYDPLPHSWLAATIIRFDGTDYKAKGHHDLVWNALCEQMRSE